MADGSVTASWMEPSAVGGNATVTTMAMAIAMRKHMTDALENDFLMPPPMALDRKTFPYPPIGHKWRET
jgi:hypothetical protein